MPTLPSRCSCGRVPGHHTRDKGDYIRHEICCACGANAYAGSWAEVLQIWDEMSAKDMQKRMTPDILRGRIMSPGTVHVQEDGTTQTQWVWVRDPEGDQALMGYQHYEDTFFFADQCEQSLQRESESAGIVFQHATALNLVRAQAEITDLWMGDDINKVRAALRQLHMAVEGGLANPLIDLLKGKKQ